MSLGGGESINQVVKKARPGSTILLHSGTYREQIELDRRITLAPAPGAEVWIDAGCDRDHGIRVTASDVWVEGLGVQRSVQAGVMVQDGASAVTLKSLTVQDYNCREAQEQSRAGISVRYGGSGIHLLDNRITRRVDLPGEARGFGNGIWFKSDSTQPSGGGHIIAGNIINGGFDGIGGEDERDPRGSFDKDTVIELNQVSDCWDDGIQVEGGNVRIYARDNVISGCASGLGLSPNLIGPVYVERNWITDLVPGFHGDQAAIKLGNGGRGVTHLFNNRVDSDGDGIKQSDPGLSPIKSSGNRLRVSGFVLALMEPLPAGSLLNGDCLWSKSKDRFVKWDNQHYSSLARFQSATGLERDGRQQADCF